MQREHEVERGMPQAVVGSAVMKPAIPPRGCYRVQVLVAGRNKSWRYGLSSEIRRAGYQVTACDNGVDALAVLVLGLPIDVMVIDCTLQGHLCCARLAVEARALRPSLHIVLTNDSAESLSREVSDLVPDALIVSESVGADSVAQTVREVLHTPPPANRSN
jgi:CheY-like chemotaxis protein